MPSWGPDLVNKLTFVYFYFYFIKGGQSQKKPPKNPKQLKFEEKKHEPPLKAVGEVMCSGMVHKSWSNSSTRYVTVYCCIILQVYRCTSDPNTDYKIQTVSFITIHISSNELFTDIHTTKSNIFDVFFKYFSSMINQKTKQTKKLVNIQKNEIHLITY